MKTVASLLLVLSVWQMSGFAQTPEPASASSPAAAALKAPGDSVADSSVRKEAEDQWKARKEAAIHSKWNISVDVQMVAVEEGKALELIPDLQSGEQASVEAAWNKLQAMIKAKEAILMGWPMVRLVDTNRSVSESILEQRYPTEFQPPLPSTPDAAKPPAERAVSEQKPPVDQKPAADQPTMKNAVPTAFETRNLGTTLEVEANVLDEGKRVHLDLAPQRVELIAMEKNGSELDQGKTIVQTPQPLFGSSKTQQSLTVHNGERQLIAVHKLTKPAGYIELHLVRALVTKSE